MILNLTQHAASAGQRAEGVVDLDTDSRDHLVRLLTVDALPSREDIEGRCADISRIAALHEPVCLQAMIGGAPWMMSALEAALLEQGIQPVYAFSVRESAEQTQADGSVRKVNVFKHTGFVFV